MSEVPTVNEIPPKTKSPPKKRHEAIRFFFGQPLESFENLLIQPSSSSTSSANQSPIKPTDFDIIRHWMHVEGQNTSNSVNIVTDNLIAFYEKYHPSVELRVRKGIQSAVTRLVQKTEKIHQNANLKYAQDKDWIEKKLKEGKWKQTRDISNKSSPAGDKELEADTIESPFSPKRPAVEVDLGRSKRIKFPNPKYR